MKVKIEKNVKNAPKGRRASISKYYLILKSFLESNNENICFTFDNEQEMLTFYGGLRRIHVRYKLNAIDFRTRENKLYLIRKKEINDFELQEKLNRNPHYSHKLKESYINKLIEDI